MTAGLNPVARPCRMGGTGPRQSMWHSARLSVTATARLLRRSIRRAMTVRRRAIAAVALLAYLSGSLGLAAPAAPHVSDRPALQPPGCACPDQAIRAGTCCCSVTVVPRPCCAQRMADSERKQAVREPGTIGSSHESDSRGSCCARETPRQPAHPQFNSCHCGHGGPDQYLLCGDPRLSADRVRFRFMPDSSKVTTSAHWEAARSAHEPPTPPPRSIGG